MCNGGIMGLIYEKMSQLCSCNVSLLFGCRPGKQRRTADMFQFFCPCQCKCLNSHQNQFIPRVHAKRATLCHATFDLLQFRDICIAFLTRELLYTNLNRDQADKPEATAVMTCRTFTWHKGRHSLLSDTGE